MRPHGAPHALGGARHQFGPEKPPRIDRPGHGDDIGRHDAEAELPIERQIADQQHQFVIAPPRRVQGEPHQRLADALAAQIGQHGERSQQQRRRVADVDARQPHRADDLIAEGGHHGGTGIGRHAFADAEGRPGIATGAERCGVNGFDGRVIGGGFGTEHQLVEGKTHRRGGLGGGDHVRDPEELRLRRRRNSLRIP